MMIIKTEVGAVILIMTALMVGIFTVVSFDKTSKDLDNIAKAVQVNQDVLNEVVKKLPPK